MDLVEKYNAIKNKLRNLINVAKQISLLTKKKNNKFSVFHTLTDNLQPNSLVYVYSSWLPFLCNGTDGRVCCCSTINNSLKFSFKL